MNFNNLIYLLLNILLIQNIEAQIAEAPSDRPIYSPPPIVSDLVLPTEVVEKSYYYCCSVAGGAEAGCGITGYDQLGDCEAHCVGHTTPHKCQAKNTQVPVITTTIPAPTAPRTPVLEKVPFASPENVVVTVPTAPSVQAAEASPQPALRPAEISAEEHQIMPLETQTIVPPSSPLPKEIIKMP